MPAFIIHSFDIGRSFGSGFKRVWVEYRIGMKSLLMLLVLVFGTVNLAQANNISALLNDIEKTAGNNLEKIYQTLKKDHSNKSGEVDFYISEMGVLFGDTSQENGNYALSSAESGFWLGELKIAYMYYSGWRVPKDDHIAGYWFSKAKQHVDFDSLDPYLFRKLNLEAYKKFFETAQFLDKSVNSMHSFKLNTGGQIYDYKRLSPQARANKSVQHNSSIFPNEKLVIEQYSTTVSLSTEQYWNLYDAALENRDANAAYKLGVLTFESNGGASLRWLLIATELGHVDAPYQAGRNILFGLANLSDPKLALQYFKIAADRGSKDGREDYNQLLANDSKRLLSNGSATTVSGVETAIIAAVLATAAVALLGSVSKGEAGDFDRQKFDEDMKRYDDERESAINYAGAALWLP